MSTREELIERIEHEGLVPECLGDACPYPGARCPCSLSPEEVIERASSLSPVEVIERASGCIHANQCHDGCHAVVVVPPHVFEAARAHRRSTWTEIPGAGDGYSKAIPEGTRLHGWMTRAYECAVADSERKVGMLVWLRTPDYAPEKWIVAPEYRAWVRRWDTLTKPEERRAMRESEPMPTMGHWEPRRGECMCFLIRESGTGALRFVG